MAQQHELLPSPSEHTPQAHPELLRQQPITLSKNPAAVYVGRLAIGSQRTMGQALNHLAELLTGVIGVTALDIDWSLVRYQHTAALRSRLQQHYQPRTVNKTLSALRGVLKEAWKLEQLAGDDYHRAIAVDNVDQKALPAGRALDQSEIKALFRACADDRTPAGRRDAAVIAVLYGAGLRRAEAVSLQLHDYQWAQRVLIVRSGKGNKDREIPLPTGTVSTLQDWLSLRGDAPGPLMWSLNRHGTLTGADGTQARQQLTPQAILYLLQKRQKEAGIQPFSAHDLRRAYITHLLQNGVGEGTVQKLAGHERLETTLQYDRRGEEVKRAAVEHLHVPYFE